MKVIDLLNKMYKRDIEIGTRFTICYKEFTLNTYEIRECEYGLMIWDLDNDSRFDSNEYILDYLDYFVEIIEADKEIEELECEIECYRDGLNPIPIERRHYNQEKMGNKINELIKEVNKLKKEGK